MCKALLVREAIQRHYLLLSEASQKNPENDSGLNVAAASRTLVVHSSLEIP
jgi:hypothetical protein